MSQKTSFDLLTAALHDAAGNFARPTVDAIQRATWFKFTYDFAKDGGATGTIRLNNLVVPAGFIVWDSCVDVLETFTSPTTDAATIALSLEADNDIVSAVEINTGTPWDEGFRAGVPVGTVASAVKCTEDRYLRMVIAVEDLTAGKMNVFLRGMMSEV